MIPHQTHARFIAAALLVTSTAVAAEPVRLALGGEPETLDPHRYNLRIEETVLSDLFLGLTTFDAEARIVPGCAESWTTSADGLTWTFTLRPALKWSDGQPLTARDFQYGLRRLLNPETAAALAYFLYPIRNAAAVNAGTAPLTALGVRAPDDRTLVIELEQPYPHLTERLIYPTGFPVPAHVIDAVGDRWIKPEHWVSNGAYRLTEWRPQSHLTLIRNPHFFDPPAIESVSYIPAADTRVQLNRFRAGELLATSGFPSSEMDWARSNAGHSLRVAPLLSITYLVFNTAAPPFDDARVREALALVVDGQLLVDKVLRTGDVVNPSLVPGIVADYTAQPMPHMHLSPSQRRDRARRLLASAGYGPDEPLEITLRYIAGGDTKKTFVAIASFWKSIGVRTKLHHSELKVHFSDLRQNSFQVAQAGWIGENNPEHYLGLLDSRTGDVNYGRYVNTRYDALMDAALAEADVAARHALLARAEAEGLADYPVVPLYTITARCLVSPAVRGWRDNPRDAHPARFLSLDPARAASR